MYKSNTPNKDPYEVQYKDAYYHSIRLLTRQDYSVHKIKTKLTDKRFSKEVVENVISELLEKKFLKEELYAGARIKGFMHKGYSVQFIIQKLAQESVTVTRDEVEEVFNEFNFTEEYQINYLIDKKARNQQIDDLVDLNFKQKLLRFLLSKGHNYSQSQTLVTNYIRSKKDEAWSNQ